MNLNQNQNQEPPADTLALINGVLEFIRGNLRNIESTWGPASPQYKAASEIMQKYFDENMEKMNIDIQKSDLNLSDLLSGMSLGEKNAP